MRPDYVWEEIPNRARAYQRFAGEIALLTTHDDISWKLPAGGWTSTAGDMGRFAAGLMGPNLIDDDTKRLMWAISGDGDTGYAMGISVGEWQGRRVVSHSGGQVGTTTYLLCSPESGHGVAIMANTEGVRGMGDLSRLLLALLIESEM
jgi:CubicO group peptidase (beta-lactamase class C family)